MKRISISDRTQYILTALFLMFCVWFAVTCNEGALSGTVSGTVIRKEPGRIEIEWKDDANGRVFHEMFDTAELDRPLSEVADSLREGDRVTVEYVVVRGLKTVRNISTADVPVPEGA